MTIEITHTRREGTLIEGTSRGDGSAEILRLREYGRTQRQPFRWSRNLDCWYLPHSRDHATYTPSLERLAQRLREEGFEVTLTVNNADRRSFSEAEQEREEKAEGRADRFGGYAANAAQSSEAAHRKSHDISERFAFGQPILVGHHSEGRARRDHARMDDAMRKSISDGDRAAHWTGRAQAAANYQEFKKDPGRTLRRIDKLRADLRAVEKWQRGQSAKGVSRNPADPELEIEHQELAEEIAHWEKVIKDAEAEGFKVWSQADFKRGDFVLYRGTWYEVLRVNPKTVTIPHIHNGVGQRIVRAADNRHDGWTWTAPYDDVSGRKSADEMQQPPQVQTSGQQEQAKQSPPIKEPVPTAETCPTSQPGTWHANARRRALGQRLPEGRSTPAMAPAERPNGPDSMALVLITSKNSRRSRKRALWALPRAEAQAVCGDPRTAGRSYMLTWTSQPGVEGADWEWTPDNGRLDAVLSDLGVTPRREWTPAAQAPAEAA
ncbi:MULTISPECIES: DUF3560 domain-containing protein [unclassified Streptomyces]|uniref:DUF3560 domain-containing protein n=1 Tax=unclassified Streptomyces TaxID=2593676 RepID=UPI000823F533|nr:DUF3560 domain-containing protein [Streptomyces sp. AmelKG-D3]MYU02150.1 DUF3560 domain-containing protein [Streptomyces sp. SID8350]SCK61674.1 protein of unknown function [Streptomyces sp. AmelKG-D3]